MTATTEINGDTYFYINIPGATSNESGLIFNNGSDQGKTKDFTFVAGAGYNSDQLTGVDNIFTVEPEPEFYTLQGVRVLNPTPGIYVVRRGNKVSKAVIR